MEEDGGSDQECGAAADGGQADKAGGGEARSERLSAALRRNLQRRKAQSRARRAPAASEPASEPEPTPDDGLPRAEGGA